MGATPEGKALDWARLEHRTRLVALGRWLSVTVAAGGFTPAWIAIMITLRVERDGRIWHRP